MSFEGVIGLLGMVGVGVYPRGGWLLWLPSWEEVQGWIGAERVSRAFIFICEDIYLYPHLACIYR